MRRGVPWALHALVAIPLLSACHSSEKPDFPVTRSVGAEGAHIEGNGFALDIPAGALDTAHDVSVDLADYTPATSTPPLGPLLHFEPSGLTFAKPVTVSLDIPEGTTGVVIWSRPDDEKAFDIVGIAKDGKGYAQGSHFSDVGTANPLDPSMGDPCSTDGLGDCPDCPDPDATANADVPQAGADACVDAPADAAPPPLKDAGCKPPARSECRQFCTCGVDETTLKSAGVLKPYEKIAQTHLCSYDPTTGDPATNNGLCPAKDPWATDGFEYLADGESGRPPHDGSTCGGWAWVETELELCDCIDDKDSSLVLCPRAETKSPVSGTAVCDSTIQYPPEITWGTTPHAPDPAKCPPGTSNWTECDEHFGAYASTTDPGAAKVACTGYDYSTGSTPHPGHLGICGWSAIKYEWRKISGTTTDCRELADTSVDASSLPPMDDDLRMRCMLTKDEWSQIESQRAACGTPARLPTPNNPDGKGGPVFSTLVAFDASGTREDLIVGQNGRNRPARLAASCSGPSDAGPGDAGPDADAGIASGTCPPWQPHDLSAYPDEKCMDAYFGGAHHAETDALCQLARRRARSGRTGGCGEMIVDRPPCVMCTAIGNIKKAFDASGLATLIVRSPSGCLLFGKDYADAGESCAAHPDVPTHCATSAKAP